MSEKTPAQILREARELIAAPERWCAESFALDSDGKDAGADSELACRWCVLGAICHVLDISSPAWGSWDYLAAMDAFKKAGLSAVEVTERNDLGHKHALEVLDNAIAIAEARP